MACLKGSALKEVQTICSIIEENRTVIKRLARDIADREKALLRHAPFDIGDALVCNGHSFTGAKFIADKVHAYYLSGETCYQAVGYLLKKNGELSDSFRLERRERHVIR